MSKKTKKAAEAGGVGSALALMQQTHDELAGVFEGEFDFDGLGGVEQGDIRLRLFLFNLKGKTEAGEQLRQDVFLESIDETQQGEIECVWLYRHRSNQWAEYDNTEKRNITKCRSFDRVTGTMEDGSERPCKGCPDAQWYTDDDGKRHRNCSAVHWMVGIELSTGLPFVLKFRRTSEPALKQYLQRHHLNRRVVKGKIGHYPLFAFRSKVRLEMHDSGNYALPVLERGDVLDGESIRELVEQAKAAKQWLEAAYQSFEEADSSADPSEAAPDTSFNPDEFSGGAGQDFIDEQPAQAG